MPPPSNDDNKPNLKDEISDLNDDATIEIKWNCNQIRSRITVYLNNTSTTMKDFQSKLRVSPNSFCTFMRQSGPHAGSGNNTYTSAHHFFSKREAAGLKMPRASTKNMSKSDEDKFDVSEVHLDDEKEGNVPVFDTCDDVRTKVDRHLRTNNVTQAVFGRAISAC